MTARLTESRLSALYDYPAVAVRRALATCSRTRGEMPFSSLDELPEVMGEDELPKRAPEGPEACREVDPGPLFGLWGGADSCSFETRSQPPAESPR